jgi:hypothetical protein
VFRVSPTPYKQRVFHLLGLNLRLKKTLWPGAEREASSRYKIKCRPLVASLSPEEDHLAKRR